MSKTVLELSHKERRNYRLEEYVEQQRYRNHTQIERRKNKAWTIARKAAQKLKKDFGANKVIVFGSLVDPFRFTAWSDIDLAASGIPPSKFYSAVAAVIDIGHAFKIDLIDIESCMPAIREKIMSGGSEL